MKRSGWETVQLARHPGRPYTLDYISNIMTDFFELHGDRLFADDKAIVGGFARLDSEPVMVIGHQKGRNTEDRVYRNFGMPNPEGFRKARRLMELAAKFKRPIITMIDTPGANPAMEAEERGQAEAIARSMFVMSQLVVPIIVVIIGEGASGGAIAIGVGDRILMLENAWYSVISPEGLASISWRDVAFKEQAANAAKLTAPDLLELGVIDCIIPEPDGGAHLDLPLAAEMLKKILIIELKALKKIKPHKLVERRLEKFAKMGQWEQES
ncbi:MAG: acetyl-CoA carboxylase carboxyltransferase subunit alpha [Patescibacteria group bacterium]